MLNMKRFRFSQIALIAIALLGCTSEPAEVGSNKQPLSVDKVDILLVVDDSGSMHGFRDEELPRLVNAFISGSDPEVGDLPRIDNVHVAVVSTNLGAGEELWDIEQPQGIPVPPDDEPPPPPGEDAMTAEMMMEPEDAGMTGDPTERESGSIPGCGGRGDDGVFAALTGDDIDRCAAQFPSFVSLDRGTAVVATTETISCLPALESMGCGFEQPLEAALKSLWPASNPAVEFLYGAGHGESENEGFLREDSLLIVIVITDEDDCSAEDPRVFVPDSLLSPRDPLTAQGLNVRCSGNPDRLYDRARYLDNLTGLRPNNDSIMFVTIAGIPPELVSEAAQADVDSSDAQERNAYFDSILDAASMQTQIDDRMTPQSIDDGLVPSCTKPGGGNAYPPRRLVELAKDFGERAVLGSLCEEDFGSVVGRILRTAAERIDAAPAPEE